MAEIALQNIEKYFGDNYVIRKLNLTIAHKEFVVLLGPSGCGKTTTLRAIAGLETIDTGDIRIDGKAVQDLRASDRDIAFVFQLFALYPHLTAYDNIAFPLRATRESKAEVDTKVRAVARSLRIEHLLNQRPSALSGGDMQRVAIGRALVRRPKAMLMDEPIGALDAALREEMRSELKRLHIENDSTTVYVTHDQVEAMSLADRIAIMNDGVLQQVGTPGEVYQYPTNLFVAQFIGSPVMNILPATVRAGGADGAEVVIGDGDAVFGFPADLPKRLEAKSYDSLVLGVRPEGVIISTTETAGHVPVEAHIIEPLGAYDIVDLKIGEQLLRARTHSGMVERVGETVWARLDAAQTHFFDTKSGDSLNIRLGEENGTRQA
ncbi:MAG: ABC transporter ATP-binding protein [Bauldia sp.]|uniref:ABC transporter ATP-binding protein n=1 Tax=Bauldia sp. TaxID=2575872 RepID=UPI001D9FC16F|nr:ABC transporter ATP-binding protein [Bauldia sp.]MCB1495875.1 ABC transporter ATP-binding protein [Bauldia sp.]